MEQHQEPNTSSSTAISVPSPKFVINWNLRSDTVLESIRKLMSSQLLTDIVLTCMNGEESIRCHKLMLVASSHYFEELLTNSKLFNDVPTPVVVLKDVAFPELLKILEFIYEGRTFVDQGKLPQFLKAADSLKIKGLVAPRAKNNGNKTKDPENSGKNNFSSPVTVNPQAANETENPANNLQLVVRPSCSSILGCSNNKSKITQRKDKKYTEEQVLEALEAIKEGMSCYQAAQKFGIPSRTLYDRMKACKIIKKERRKSPVGKQEVPSAQCSQNDNVNQIQNENLDDLVPVVATLKVSRKRRANRSKKYQDGYSS